jgi:1-acyl-sn-glycerol-3-phosphate acyltransferase
MDSGWKPPIKTVAYAVAKVCVGALVFPYFRLSREGLERIPRQGGLLVAANHFSYADPLILGVALPRRLRFIMGADQFEKPGVKIFSRLMDVLPIRRDGSADMGPIRRALRLLKDGQAVAIFPEGQRSRTGTLLQPAGGLGLLAVKAGVPVVPVAIIGTREAYPPGTHLPRPRKVSLHVGEPLSFPRSAGAEEVSLRTWEAIQDLFRLAGREDYLGPAPEAPADSESDSPGDRP